MRFSPSFRFVILALGFLSAVDAAPPHPTVLTVMWKKEFRPVVRMMGTDPVVMFEGKEKRIREEPTYLLDRIERFSDSSAEVLSAELGLNQIKFVVDRTDTEVGKAEYGNQGGFSEFKAKVRSNEGLVGGFVVVVIYARRPPNPSMPPFESQIVVHALPTLPAGVEVPIKIASKAYTYRPNQKFFVQLYDSEGREVLTRSGRAGWEYFAELERFRLKEAIVRAAARIKSSDFSAVPFMVVRPLLPAGATKPTEALMTEVMVSAEGIVSDVRTREGTDPGIAAAVKEAVSGWLFMPSFRGGVAIPARVSVPIQF